MSDDKKTAALIISTIPVVRGGDLTQLRSDVGLSAQDLADILHVSRATLYRIEAADDVLPPADCLMIQYLRGFLDIARHE